MDQRQSAQHPFSRPQPLPLSHDVRYVPIPPPPYFSQQLPARQDLPPQTGPFLHHRNDIDRTRTPPVTDRNGLYRQPTTSQYQPNPFSAAHSPVVDYHNHSRQGSKGSGADYGNGSVDRYKAYGPEGTSKAVCCHYYRSLAPFQLLARCTSSLLRLYTWDFQDTAQAARTPATTSRRKRSCNRSISGADISMRHSYRFFSRDQPTCFPAKNLRGLPNPSAMCSSVFVSFLLVDLCCASVTPGPGSCVDESVDHVKFSVLFCISSSTSRDYGSGLWMCELCVN